ncbi:peptidase, S1 (chymotrypsin) family [Myxococcus xanthus DK 1622]|uniref:Serine protease n=2 Tax=Myxococcaceae TaxID=31 RepID=Q1D2F7_MYXXD|nr:peptidase, S1 (chymotrypsin) family [Myxococcus xanthus DK 1622]NOJ56375.1 trypsin-like peptidase domain-containing protein [Myxococcus xanthus]QPM77527.1 trypsin-like peptidase domain-containing protein [Myxococcus xanthus]QVW66594.1 trypsin-like peptidase domain-containing protein [Myxococcus xanthus DZ2]UEO07278.1 serine protease [Myxococcus xanthus DZ2]
MLLDIPGSQLQQGPPSMQVILTHVRRKLFGVLLCSLSVACVQDSGPVTKGGDTSAPTDTLRQGVVYGVDDRKDYYAHSDATLKKFTRESTVALVDVADLDTSNPSSIGFFSQTLQEAQGLCSDQRFLNDPTAAFCSGTLIDNDLVLTAGHCVKGPLSCASTRFVFKYYRTGATTLEPVTSEDVFRCSRVVVRNASTVGGRQLDYAIVQLDRPVSALRAVPAPVRMDSVALSTTTQLAVIGSGSGIPFKIDSGGKVLASRASTLDFFVGDTDTFGGNSGSGVYAKIDGSYLLAGILVRGNKDYVKRIGPAGECYVVNVITSIGSCTDAICSAEAINYVRPAIDAYCAVATNTRLCPGQGPATPVTFDFATSGTNNATRNTVAQNVTLSAGETLYVGTAMVMYATARGDTYLRLDRYETSTNTYTGVANNDDAYDSLSYIRYTAKVAGTYRIRVGCARDSACAGRVSYIIR